MFLFPYFGKLFWISKEFKRNWQKFITRHLWDEVNTLPLRLLVQPDVSNCNSVDLFSEHKSITNDKTEEMIDGVSWLHDIEKREADKMYSPHVAVVYFLKKCIGLWQIKHFRTGASKDMRKGLKQVIPIKHSAFYRDIPVYRDIFITVVELLSWKKNWP